MDLRDTVPGFREGVQLLGRGGMIELVIPANLGYGEAGNPQAKIPPNAKLRYRIELIDL